MTLLSDIQELTEKANRYENLKGRYVDHSAKLKAIIGQLQTLLSEIEPGSILTNHRKTGFNYSEEIGILYNLMRGGTRINKNFLEKTYPDLDPKSHNYILNTLQKKHKVLKARKGNMVELYLLKEE